MSYIKLTDFAAKDALLSGNPSKLLRGTEIDAEFSSIESAMTAAEAVNITAPIIAASTSKTTPVDADVLPILDSAATNILKKVTWVNIKATLKTYFDTLYAAVGSFAAAGANADITSLTALTAGGLPNNSVLTADIADAQITPAKLSQPLTVGTAVATTSGTSRDFIGIPSWVNRITVTLRGVSISAGSSYLMQLGAGSIQTTGYAGLGNYIASASTVSQSTSTAGLVIVSLGAGSPADVVATFIRQSGNIWLGTYLGVSGGYGLSGITSVALSGVLDRLRLTTTSGTDTFDAGSFNILYE